MAEIQRGGHRWRRVSGGAASLLPGAPAKGRSPASYGLQVAGNGSWWPAAVAAPATPNTTVRRQTRSAGQDRVR